jgi:hypothetical protein
VANAGSLGGEGQRDKNSKNSISITTSACSWALLMSRRGTETRGPIRFHKVMAWIHGPGMIATSILGIMAFDQRNKGEKVHGIAQAHGPVAIVTAEAFGAALLSVSVKF